MIDLKNVTKTFGPHVALDRVTMRIKPGEFVCVTGASGAGKSTLLSLLVGACDVTGGTVSLDGVDIRNVPPAALQLFRRRVGIVYQDQKLFAHRTVAEHVAFALELCGATDKQIASRVTALLKRLNLTARAHAFPSQLSHGEKALTGVARAVAHEPMIVIADEPLADLDQAQSKEIITLLREIQARGATVIVATRDVALAASLGVRVIELKNGKVTRDEVPGQVTEERPVTVPAIMTMQEAPEKQPDEKEVLVRAIGRRATKNNTLQESGSRKVRITSIHSD